MTSYKIQIQRTHKKIPNFFRHYELEIFAIVVQSRTMINNHLKDKNFVTITAVEKCLGEHMKHHVMIITGEQGCGKTKIGLEILSKCHQLNDNCDVIILSNLTEIRKAIATENSENGIVLLMDDVFGKTKCTYEDIHELSLDILNAYINGGNLTVIFIMRTKIFQCIQHLINSHSLFQDHFHVNLNSENYKLKKAEKMTILFDYCKRNKIEFCKESANERFEDEGILNKSTTVFLHLSKLTKIIDSDPEIGFLKACVLFTTRRQFTRLGLQLFMYPTMNMISKIDSLRTVGRTNINDRLSFVILVYILLNDNCLTRNNVNLEKIRAIDHSCYGTGSMIHTISSIWDIIDDLNGVYLKYNAESAKYEYKHENILQCVLLSFGKIATEKVIPLLDISFIENVVKLENYNAKEEEVCLIVPKRLYQCLAHRLKQLLKEKCTQSFRFVESLVGFTFMKQNDVNFQGILLDNIDDISATGMLNIECEGKMEKVAFYFPAALLYYSVQIKSSIEQTKKCLDYIRTVSTNVTEVNSYTCCILILISFEIVCINDDDTVILYEIWNLINDLKIGCNIMHYIHICLKQNKISMSRRILYQLSCQVHIATYFTDMLCNALQSHHSPVNEQMIVNITWVVENISDPDAQEMLQIICNTDFEDIIIFLLHIFSQRQVDFSKILLSACNKGWYHVVTWFIDTKKEIKEDLNILILAACKFYWDDILDILINNRKINIAIEAECLLNTFELTISLIDYACYGNLHYYTDIKTIVKGELRRQDCFTTFVGWVLHHFHKNLPCKNSSEENFARTLTILEMITDDGMIIRTALDRAIQYKVDLYRFVISYTDHDSLGRSFGEIVKFIMHNTNMDKFDLRCACNAAIMSGNFKMLRIIWHNIDHNLYNISELLGCMIETFNDYHFDFGEIKFEAEMIVLICNTNSYNINWMHIIRSTLKTGATEILKWIVQNTQFDHFQTEATVNMLFDRHINLRNFNFLFEIENNERTNLIRLTKRHIMKNLYRLLSSFPHNDIFELLKNIKEGMEISDKKIFFRNAVKFRCREVVEYISFLEVPIDILNTQYFIQSAWIGGCYAFINFLLDKNVILFNILNVAEKYKCHRPSDGMVKVMTCVLRGCDYNSASIRSIVENLLHHHETIDAKILSVFLQFLLEKTPNLAEISSSFVVTVTLIYTDCFATVQKMLEIAKEDIDKTLFMQSLFKSASRQINISIETYLKMLTYVLNSFDSAEFDIMSIIESALKVLESREDMIELMKYLLQSVDNVMFDSRLLIFSLIHVEKNSLEGSTVYFDFLDFLLVNLKYSTTDITDVIKLLSSEPQISCKNYVRCVVFLLNESNFSPHDTEEIISCILIWFQNHNCFACGPMFQAYELLENMLDNPNLDLKNVNFLPFISKYVTYYPGIHIIQSQSIVDVINLVLTSVKLNVKDVTKMFFGKPIIIFDIYDNAVELTTNYIEMILKHFSLTEINTLLTEACHYGNVNIVEVLLRKQKKQLDLNAAFCVSCVSGHVHVAKSLWDYIDRNEFDQKLAVDKFLISELTNRGMLLWILHNIDSKSIDMQKAMTYACAAKDFISVKWLWNNVDKDLFDIDVLMEEYINVPRRIIIAFANQDLSIIENLAKKTTLKAFVISEELLRKLIMELYKSELVIWVVRNIHLRFSYLKFIFQVCISKKDIQCVIAVADKFFNRTIDITNSFYGSNLHTADIMWFLQNCGFAYSMIDMKTLMSYACNNDQIIIAQFLWRNIDQTLFDMTKCLIASGRGSRYLGSDSSILQWLVDNVSHDKFDLNIVVGKIHNPTNLKLFLNSIDLTCVDIESLFITTYKLGRFNKLRWLLQEIPTSLITFKVPMCSLLQIDGSNVTSFDNEEGEHDDDFYSNCMNFCDGDYESDEENDIDVFYSENYNYPLGKKRSNETSNYSQNESNKKEEIAFLHILMNIQFENSDINTIIREMSRRGWLKTLKWVHSNYTLDGFNAEFVINEACQNGRKNIVKWLLLQNFNLDQREVMKESCGYGWMDIVIWLWETADQQIFNMTDSLQEACEYKRLNIVRWVTDNVPTEHLNVQSLIIAACKNSWIDIILWVFKHLDSTCYDISRAVKEACAFDALEVVQIIHKHHPFDQNMAAEAMYESLQNKSEHCKGEVAMFLFQKFNADIFDTEIILMKACEYGWIALVKKIFEKGIENPIVMAKAFHLACMNGETQIVEIIICNGNPRQLDLDSAMAEICSHGWDEILNLILIRKNIPHELFDMEKALNTACEFGQLEIVEILSENVDVKLLNLKTAMNKSCRSRMNERLVRFLLDKFDNEKFEMDKVTFAVQEYEWQNITKAYTESVQIS